MININKKVKDFLTDKGIMEKTLAQKIGMSKQNLNILLDNDDMKFSQYFKICEALMVDYLYFIIQGEEHQTIYNHNDTPKSENHIKKNYKVKGDANAVGENTTTYGREAELMKEIEFLKEKNKLLESQLEHSNNQISFLQNVITKFS